MNYEHRYKEALAKAREFQKSKDGLCVLTAESIFPELKESEDEKIRKALVRFHKSTIDVDGIKGEDIIAWLEKQKSVCQIVKREEGCNKLVTKFGIEKELVNERNLSNAHLWTIRDAKDGDVLVDVYGTIGIFQKNDDFDWSSYCSLGSNGGFRCFAIEHELDRSHPATKEQRDLLFQKIKEAGYQWDAEKKELKKIHVIDEGKAEMDYCFTKMMAGKKANPTWSEDDERIVTALMEGFRYHQLFNPRFGEVPNAEIIDWIKSLKERLS